MRNTSLTRNGSSPLTRGKPCGVGVAASSVGLIPAHAGKTSFILRAMIFSPAHPRSRGENRSDAKARFNIAGSSPLTRGKQASEDTEFWAAGLIPAHAGKTDP